MAEPTPQQIVDALRAAGLDVYEMPGWRGRCRCHSGSHELKVGPTGRGWRSSGPEGVTVHHTAGNVQVGQRAIDYTNNILIAGNGSTPGPLCLAGIDGDGRLLMVGAGRANHIGSVSQDATDLTFDGVWPTAGSTNERGHGVDGNSFTYGWEIMALGVPSTIQRNAAIIATAAILNLIGQPARATHGHGEASDQRDFSDPGFNMGAFRTEVAAVMAMLKQGKKPSLSDPLTPVLTPAAPKPATPTPTVQEDFIMAVTKQTQDDFNALMHGWATSRNGSLDLARAVLTAGTWGDVDQDSEPDRAIDLIFKGAARTHELIRRNGEMQGQIAALAEAVKQLDGGQALDMEAIKDASEEGSFRAVGKALKSVDAKVTLEVVPGIATEEDVK